MEFFLFCSCGCLGFLVFVLHLQKEIKLAPELKELVQGLEWNLKGMSGGIIILFLIYLMVLCISPS